MFRRYTYSVLSDAQVHRMLQHLLASCAAHLCKPDCARGPLRRTRLPKPIVIRLLDEYQKYASLRDILGGSSPSRWSCSGQRACASSSSLGFHVDFSSR